MGYDDYQHNRKRNTPYKLNDIVEKRLIDALRRGNTRTTACALAGITVPTFHRWMHQDVGGADSKEELTEFARKVREAEALAEDEAVVTIRAQKQNWQGMAWWASRRPRSRWKDKGAGADKRTAVAANDALHDMPLADLEAAIQDAAELKRQEVAKKETG